MKIKIYIYLIFAICILTFDIDPAIAKEDKFNITLPTLTIKPCAKPPIALSGGSRYGKLTKTKTILYAGASVVCDERGDLSKNNKFIVTGQTKSTFGKNWYYITFLASGKKAWIPAKYVTLGKSYAPIPDYTTEQLDNTTLTTDTELNVRSCPSTNCNRLSSLVPGINYPILRKSSNGWYEVRDEASHIQGWVSGKYVSLSVNKDVEQRREISKSREEKTITVTDPCDKTEILHKYEEILIVRATKNFDVNSSFDFTCTSSHTLAKDQAFVLIGVSDNSYAMGYTDAESGQYEIGFYDLGHEENFYKESYLPLHIQALKSDVPNYLKSSQEYWNSWKYSRDKIWNRLTNAFSLHPWWMSVYTFLVISGVLYCIPFTRPFVRRLWGNTFKTIVEIAREITSVIYGMLSRRELQVITSHWNTMCEGMQISPKEFYRSLEANLRQKEIPNSKTFEITWREGGIFSPHRDYLRIRMKKNALDFCCARFGTGTFFSWWSGQLPSGILAFFYMLPILSWFAHLFEKYIRPETYYKIDSTMMFQSLVHGAMLETLDAYTNEKGLKPLTSDERKPKEKSFFDKV